MKLYRPLLSVTPPTSRLLIRTLAPLSGMLPAETCPVTATASCPIASPGTRPTRRSAGTNGRRRRFQLVGLAVPSDIRALRGEAVGVLANESVTRAPSLRVYSEDDVPRGQPERGLPVTQLAEAV